MLQGYGMTEASAVLTMLTPSDHRRGGDPRRSAGRPVFGVAINQVIKDDLKIDGAASGAAPAKIIAASGPSAGAANIPATAA